MPNRDLTSPGADPSPGSGGPPALVGGDPVLARASFRVTPADLAACYRAQFRWRFKRPQILLWPLLASVTCVAVVLAGSGGDWTGRDLLEPGLVAFGLSLLLFPLAYVLTPLTARRHVRQQKYLRHEWRVELSRSGLRAMTPGQDNMVSWTEYVAWSEDRTVVLVYQSDHLVQFIPTRALTPEALRVFHGLVAHLPRR